MIDLDTKYFSDEYKKIFKVYENIKEVDEGIKILQECLGHL